MTSSFLERDDLIRFNTARCNHKLRGSELETEIFRRSEKEVAVNLYQRRLYQAKIEQLIGKLITVEPGAFEYLDDSANPPVMRWVEVTQPYQMPQDDVTQEQYDWIASLINASLQVGEQGMPTAEQAMNPYGSDPNLVDPKKPMGGLTIGQWKRYLTQLNEVIAPLWEGAYPGQLAPQFRFPNESELRLAMTDL